MALLDVSNLTITFPVRREDSVEQVIAVRDVSFSIGEKEVLGLVGESGSGKSVTSLAVMGLLIPTATVQGSIQFGGEELSTASEDAKRRLRGKQMAMIFQEPMTALNPVMRIGDQVAEAVLAHNRIGK